MSDVALTTELQTVAVTSLPVPRRRCERGMSTAEYAVGTIAAASFAGVLIKILTDPSVQQTLLDLFLLILRHFMQVG